MYLGNEEVITSYSIVWDAIIYPCFRYLPLVLEFTYIQGRDGAGIMSILFAQHPFDPGEKLSPSDR